MTCGAIFRDIQFIAVKARSVCKMLLDLFNNNKRANWENFMTRIKKNGYFENEKTMKVRRQKAEKNVWSTKLARVRCAAGMRYIEESKLAREMSTKLIKKLSKTLSWKWMQNGVYIPLDCTLTLRSPDLREQKSECGREWEVERESWERMLNFVIMHSSQNTDLKGES